jgi:hypothetical protein
MTQISRYHFNLEGELLEIAQRGMKANGFRAMSKFIRKTISRSETHLWTDRDMKDFALFYDHMEPNPPYLLESEDDRLKRALIEFKKLKHNP